MKILFGGPRKTDNSGFWNASDRMSTQRLYRVTFTSQGQVYEIYARNVSHGGMMGFVEVEKIVFGQKSAVLVDPTEERLKTEFEHVLRSYIPLHAIVRIDEVAKQGPARITESGGDAGSKVTPFPLYTPSGGANKK